MVALLSATTLATSPITSRYCVTAESLDVGSSAKLCVAVDASDAHGVWWWQPGTSGCSSRSTGPTLFKAESATLSKHDGTVEAGFRLPLHGLPNQPKHIDVRLVIERGRMRSQAPDSGVDVAHRNDLHVPFR
ncbi:MAG: hypothetical protein ACREBE_11700 [bacterium]